MRCARRKAAACSGSGGRYPVGSDYCRFHQRTDKPQTLLNYRAIGVRRSSSS